MLYYRLYIKKNITNCHNTISFIRRIKQKKNSKKTMLKNGWGMIALCYGHTKYNVEHSFWQGTRLDCKARRPRSQA
jgi:hypothetical protein